MFRSTVSSQVQQHDGWSDSEDDSSPHNPLDEAEEVPAPGEKQAKKRNLDDLYSSQTVGSAKRRVPRPKLTEEDLTGPNGLIRLVHDMPRNVRSLPQQNTKQQPSLTAAASYSKALMEQYNRWFRTVQPALHADDCIWTIQSKLGPKKAVKDHLEFCRRDVRDSYLERILGRETATRLISELQEQKEQEQQEAQEDEQDQDAPTPSSSGDPNTASPSNTSAAATTTTTVTAATDDDDNDGPTTTHATTVTPHNKPSLQTHQQRQRRAIVDSDDDDEVEFEFAGAGSSGGGGSNALQKHQQLKDDDGDSSSSDDDDDSGMGSAMNKHKVPVLWTPPVETTKTSAATVTTSATTTNVSNTAASDPIQNKEGVGGDTENRNEDIEHAIASATTTSTEPATRATDVSTGEGQLVLESDKDQTLLDSEDASLDSDNTTTQQLSNCDEGEHAPPSTAQTPPLTMAATTDTPTQLTSPPPSPTLTMTDTPTQLAPFSDNESDNDSSCSGLGMLKGSPTRSVATTKAATPPSSLSAETPTQLAPFSSSSPNSSSSTTSTPGQQVADSDSDRSNTAVMEEVPNSNNDVDDNDGKPSDENVSSSP